jgi:hypothetical protein
VEYLQVRRIFVAIERVDRAQFPRLRFKQFGTAQPIDDAQPVGVGK